MSESQRCRESGNSDGEIMGVGFSNSILEAAAAVDAFLGGGLDLAAMSAAVDASLYRQRAGASLPGADRR